MTVIEIAPLENGGHRNQTGDIKAVPEGWAVIPEDMAVPGSFPFVDIEVDGGVIIRMTAGEVPQPEPSPPTPEERITALEQDKTVLSAQLQAAIQSGAFLEDCLVEMAGIVYA